MATGYINPLVAQALAAQVQGLQPQQPQAPAPPPIDPLAPLPPPQAPAAMPQPDLGSLLLAPQADNPNDGINSVGRPSDQEDPAVAAEKVAKRDKALKKLQRQSKGEALLALGAQLLSAPTFGQGISKGLAAFSAKMNEARTQFRPTHKEVAGGAFDQATDPVTGEVTYTRTPAADFLENKLQIGVDGKIKVAEIGATAKTEVATINNTGAMDRTKFTWNTRKSIADLDRESREGIAQARNDTQLAIAKIRSQGGGKPNASMEKQITDLGEDLVTINDTLSRSAPVLEAIKTGKLTFNPVNNGLNTLKNLGVLPSDETSRAYAQYSTLRESLRGAYLMAFKGVQTEGDAVRAFDAIFPAQGDTTTVKAAIETVVNRIQQQALLKQRRLSEISGYRATPEPDPTTQGPSKEDLMKKYGLK